MYGFSVGDVVTTTNRNFSDEDEFVVREFAKNVFSEAIIRVVAKDDPTLRTTFFPYELRRTGSAQ